MTPQTKRIVRWGAVALFVLVTGAALVVTSGIVPIKASSGHFAITHWFLHFAMERSVSTHALAVPEPRLSEPWLVMKGAAHYELGCRPCHGSPGTPPPMLLQHMTPAPPELSHRIAKWKAEELFYIVKHGVKFTAMPAWPAHERDDEVWAMVAFLRALPNLDRSRYRALIEDEGDFDALTLPLGERVPADVSLSQTVASCARCHGRDGEGRGSAAFPKLAGQKPVYQREALRAYAQDRRHSGIMQPIAAGLTHEQMDKLADYYASMPVDSTRANDETAAQQLAAGREIATFGIPKQGVPSCADCHGPGSGPRNRAYPKLAGQYEDYLLLQLELFKAKRRGGSHYAHLMEHVAARLKPKQMRDVARYYASLAP